METLVSPLLPRRSDNIQQYHPKKSIPNRAPERQQWRHPAKGLVNDQRGYRTRYSEKDPGPRRPAEMIEQMVILDGGDEGGIETKELGDEVLDGSEGVCVSPLLWAAFFMLLHH